MSFKGINIKLYFFIFKEAKKVIEKKIISVILSGAIITSTAASVMAQDYVVKKGDTLCSIAKNFNTTYQVLAEINNIENPNLIFPNQVLKTAETA